MSMFRGHGLFDDDVGIFTGVGKPINTAPLDSLFGYTASIGIRPIVEISYCPKALAGVCGDTTDAYRGFTCAPNLNSSYAGLVPLPPEIAELPAPYADYARGNAEYARLVRETVAHLVKTHGVEEIRRWKFEAWNEPNGMGAWCDERKDDCNKRNLWGNHNLTTPDSAPVSFYPAWYKAISDAVVSIDSQLTIGGPASSDCWASGIDGAKCYGGHPRPTVDELLDTVGMNWALGIVEYGAKADVRVDFSSTHSYSTPCGNASVLFEDFRSFTEAIRRSSRPNTSTIVTEWSADPDPAGVGCNDIYAPGSPVIPNFHDTAAQATFAAKTVFLVDGMVPLLSHWAFSDIFEEQGFTWNVFNGGFGLVNRFGVRKPVFNAFKLLHEAGNRRWNVSGVELTSGRAGVVVWASQSNDGDLHLIAVNHESADLNVTIQIKSAGGIGTEATVARIDDTHANAYTAWLQMGSPKADAYGVLDAKVLAALHKAAVSTIPLSCILYAKPSTDLSLPVAVRIQELVEEPIHVAEDLQAGVKLLVVCLELPHHGIARVRIAPSWHKSNT